MCIVVFDVFATLFPAYLLFRVASTILGDPLLRFFVANAVFG